MENSISRSCCPAGGAPSAHPGCRGSRNPNRMPSDSPQSTALMPGPLGDRTAEHEELRWSKSPLCSAPNLRRNAVYLPLKKIKKSTGFQKRRSSYPHTHVIHTKGITHFSFQGDDLNVGSLLVFKPTKGFKAAFHRLGASSASLRIHLAT